MVLTNVDTYLSSSVIAILVADCDGFLDLLPVLDL